MNRMIMKMMFREAKEEITKRAVMMELSKRMNNLEYILSAVIVSMYLLYNTTIHVLDLIFS